MSALLAAWMAAQLAQGVNSPFGDPHPGSLEELVRDLDGPDASRRKFAIREINRSARVARKHEFGSLDSDATMDALQQLEFLDAHAASVCIKLVRNDVEVRGCARLLGHLETTAAKRPLQEARTRATSRGVIRVLDRTIATLEQAEQEGAQ